jgi:hypothetical protein
MSILIIGVGTPIALSTMSAEDRSSTINEIYDNLENIHDIQEFKRAELSYYLKGTNPEDFRAPSYISKENLQLQRQELLNFGLPSYKDNKIIETIFARIQEASANNNSLTNISISSSEYELLRLKLIELYNYSEEEMSKQTDESLKTLMIAAFEQMN